MQRDQESRSFGLRPPRCAFSDRIAARHWCESTLSTGAMLLSSSTSAHTNCQNATRYHRVPALLPLECCCSHCASSVCNLGRRFTQPSISSCDCFSARSADGTL